MKSDQVSGDNSGTVLRQVKTYILVIWIVLNSGAWVIPRNSLVTAFNYLCIVLAAMKVGLLDHRRIVKHRSSAIVLAAMVMCMAISFLANGDFHAVQTYVGLDLMLLLGYLVSITLSFEDFKRIYTNLLLVIAMVALLFAAFNNKIANIASRFPLVEGTSASYRNLYVYLYPLYSPYRNSGIFWEPGAFAVFLNIALIFTLFSQKKNRWRIANSIILVAAIITTGSTAAYVNLVVTSVAYIFANKKGVRGRFLSISLLIVVALLLGNSSVMANLRNKLPFATTDNKSTITRWYSTLGDLHIVGKNPLFGVGFSGYPAVASLYAQRVGYAYSVDANTISYAGALFGVWFIVFLLVALLSTQNSFKLSMLSKAVVGILFVLLFLPQNFIEKPILYVLAFYGIDSSTMLYRKWGKYRTRAGQLIDRTQEKVGGEERE